MEEPIAKLVHQVIYASAATQPFDAAALRLLLSAARENNGRLNVSGLLLHEAGSFLQVLEGAQPDVEALYEKISRDKRHAHVAVLSRQDLAEREFGDWQMGFFDAHKAQTGEIPGFNSFFSGAFTEAERHSSRGAAARVLGAFRQGRWRSMIQ